LDGSSALAWRKSLLVARYRLMHNVEHDNFDVGRYGEATRNAFYADQHALAEQALRKWKPRLAISLYHRYDDLFSIPMWLKDLGCNCEFMLDHYSIHHEETVLYARSVQ
jgi:hypothetical protein